MSLNEFKSEPFINGFKSVSIYYYKTKKNQKLKKNVEKKKFEI